MFMKKFNHKSLVCSLLVGVALAFLGTSCSENIDEAKFDDFLRPYTLYRCVDVDDYTTNGAGSIIAGPERDVADMLSASDSLDMRTVAIVDNKLLVILKIADPEVYTSLNRVATLFRNAKGIRTVWLECPIQKKDDKYFVTEPFDVKITSLTEKGLTLNISRMSSGNDLGRFTVAAYVPYNIDQSLDSSSQLFVASSKELCDEIYTWFLATYGDAGEVTITGDDGEVVTITQAQLESDIQAYCM